MTDQSIGNDVLFVTLISQFHASTLIALGQMENPVTKQKETNLEQAKFSIDILGMLEEKTKGNLKDEEENVLKKALTGLRMAYVEAAK